MSLLQHHSSKHQFFSIQFSLWPNSHTHTWQLGKPYLWLDESLGFPDSSVGKESACNAGERIGYPLQYPWASLVVQLVKNLPAMWENGFDPWLGKIPWRTEQLPTPVFWPGEFHGLCSPWGHEQFSLSIMSDSLRPCGPQHTSRRDGRRGEIAFRIKPHTRQRCSEGSYKTLCTPGDLTETEPTCLWVFAHLLLRDRSAVACHRGEGSGCSRPGCGISPLGGGRH